MCFCERRIEGMYLVKKGQQLISFTEQQVPQYPLNKTGRWSSEIHKLQYCRTLKHILFSVSIFPALLRLYIRIANMVKAEKALLVQLATVQQHYVLLQAKHLFQASRKQTSSLKHISTK